MRYVTSFFKSLWLSLIIVMASMSVSLHADNLPLSMADAIKDARQGNANAMLILANELLQRHDQHLDKDAFVWALHAARLGHPDAAALSGRLYRTGRGITKNYIKARYWLNIASTSGARGASLELALLYADHGFNGRDIKKANIYFQIALNKTDPRACLLVVQSKYRRGTEPSLFLPELTCAAHGNIPIAMRMLADVLDQTASPQSQAKAARWRLDAEIIEQSRLLP